MNSNAQPIAAAVKSAPATPADAGRHDVDSTEDESRPLLYPVSFDECFAKGIPVICVAASITSWTTRTWTAPTARGEHAGLHLEVPPEKVRWFHHFMS
ncbi:MAG: hypothetical protein V4819_10755 [Verrucomicrobiota bacterium]